MEALRQEYLDTRTQEKGAEILHKLIGFDHEEIDWIECKDIITMIIADMPLEKLLTKYQIIVLEAIPNTNSHVVDVMANLINGKIKSQQEALVLSQCQAVLIAFARRIDEPECFESIARLIAKEVNMVVQELMLQLEALKGEKLAENRFRIYQVLLESFKSATYSDQMTPILRELIADAKNRNDVLTQLSAIELLGDIALSSRDGAMALKKELVPEMIHKMMVESKMSPDGGFLFTAAIKFFGQLSRQYADTIEAYPEHVNFVFDLIQHFDLLDASQRVLAFDTLANVAYTKEAKKIIERDHEAIRSVLKSFGAAMNHGPAQLRVRHIEAAIVLFENCDDDLAHEWYQAMGGEALTMTIMNSVTKPFMDIRTAFMKLIECALDYPKIMADFERFAPFNDWLLKETEEEYETKQMKRRIVRKMIEKSHGLDEEYLKKLRESLEPKKETPQVELAL